MMTARNAGMRAIGVSWGFRPVEELLEAGAEVILETPGDLLAWLVE
jgi:phosphoglycolate phosphatase